MTTFATPRRPLAAGECRLRLTEQDHRLVHYLVAVAAEHPAEFGGQSDWGGTSKAYEQMHASLTRRLTPGEIVLTRHQREFLHTVLDRAATDPQLFGDLGRNPSVTFVFGQLRDRLVKQLPRRGAGCY